MSDRWHEMIMILKMVCKMEVSAKCEVRILEPPKDVGAKDSFKMLKVYEKCKGG